MTVRELNREQLSELKVTYYAEKNNDSISYGEIADINELVTDEEIFEEYDAVDFSPDDFFCSAGQEEE